MKIQRELGVTYASIPLRVERWASIAAMTNYCNWVHVGMEKRNKHESLRVNGDERRVKDPIDESSKSVTSYIRKQESKMSDKKEELSTTQAGPLATTFGGSLERPDYVGKSHRGINFGKSDTATPRVALAQPLSPEVTEGDPALIPGLKAGDLFNTGTKEIYGRELFVQIIRRDAPRAMEFRPMDDGGGVLDPNVPLGDPRLAWGADGEKPSATLFLDYIALTLPANKPVEDRIVALSFKSSGIKVAKRLNSLIAYRNADIWAGVYKLSTDAKLVPKPHKIYLVANAGWVSQVDLALGEEMHEAVKDLDLVIEHVAPTAHEDPDAFEPAKYEKQAATDM